MLGILDRLFVFSIFNNLEEEVQYAEESKKYTFDTTTYPGNSLWICFSGWSMTQEKVKNLSFLPQEGKVVSFSGPLSLIGKTPEETKQALIELKRVINKIISWDRDRELKFYGFSAGTLPAFYFANNLNCKKLIAVSPAPRLGDGIYMSPVTHFISKLLREDRIGPKTYNKLVEDFHQEGNMKNLPNDIQIFASGKDFITPAKMTREVVSQLKKKGYSPKYKEYKFLDHVSLIFYLGWLNKKKKDPYKLKQG
ncbi:MAG: hypothetical protein HN576_16745 [Bacteriovoracaceae bacterium]|jgi:hypothetical protein|nr:hypothetical protein [Bacteriovoracaceae bacterium]